MDKAKKDIKALKKARRSNGITLIALVVTLVVLLILAGISIMVLFGDNGVIKTAKEAGDIWNKAAQNEQAEIGNLGNKLNELASGIGGKAEIPEGLEVGTSVTYTPNGSYGWNVNYATSDGTGVGAPDSNGMITLKSGTGESFHTNKWKVLSINKSTGEVELVPETVAEGTVKLQGAQGYNNAVKLLNDACSSLYGNISKGIRARSIKIEDIEKYITPEALEAGKDLGEGWAKYGEQIGSAYTETYSKYPVIYGQERLRNINGTTSNTGLGVSEQTRFIEKTEGTSTEEKIGQITTANSIQPYGTAWRGEMQESSFAEGYYSLLGVGGDAYWVASRCVIAESGVCAFYVRGVGGGYVDVSFMAYSHGDEYDYVLSLFPVVSLSSKLIEGNKASGFSVK